MLSVFTVLVWIPLILAAPTSRGSWSEFTLSWAISGAAWVVAASFGVLEFGHPGDGHFSHPARRNTSAALIPPNPNEFDRITSGQLGRPTRSM